MAEALASVVIREKAFESVSDATFETAVKVLKTVKGDLLYGKLRNLPGTLQTVVENSKRSWKNLTSMLTFVKLLSADK